MGTIRMFAVFMMVTLASANLSTLDPFMPIETDQGIAPLSSCQLSISLNYTVKGIAEEMIEFGISDFITKQFALYIINDAAASAKASSEVKCFTEKALQEIGDSLGKIIQTYLINIEPEKRRSNGNEQSFNFNGNENDHTVGGVDKTCCKCSRSEKIMTRSGVWRTGCWKGPCCPRLCESLRSLRGGSSVGERDCCTRSKRSCLQRRKK